MLKASGVILPAIKEVHNEGASTPEVIAKGSSTPIITTTGQHGEIPSGSEVEPKVNLPEQLRGLMKVWGESSASN